MPGGFVTVRYVGGSHDGAVRPLPEEDAVLGYPLPLPPRDRYAAPDTDPSALLASLALGYKEAPWMMAGAVSLFAVVCGTVVTSLAFARQPLDLRHNAGSAAKEQVEDDAYDVVSARG